VAKLLAVPIQVKLTAVVVLVAPAYVSANVAGEANVYIVPAVVPVFGFVIALNTLPVVPLFVGVIVYVYWVFAVRDVGSV
jgi:hypothetical protein